MKSLAFSFLRITHKRNIGMILKDCRFQLTDSESMIASRCARQSVQYKYLARYHSHGSRTKSLVQPAMTRQVE